MARTYKDSHETLKPALDPAAAKAIAKKLVEAKNPVLHAGGGILLAQASEELAALAEFLDLPVSRTLAGQGCLSDQHPLMVGQTGFWGLEFTHSLTTNATWILGLAPASARPTAPAGIRASPSIPIRPPSCRSTSTPTRLAATTLWRSAPSATEDRPGQILEEVKKICPKGKSNPELRAQIAKAKAAFKESNAAISSDGRFPMTPQRILKDVKEVIPEDAIIFTDVGWNKNGVAQEFDITVPGTIHHSSGLATMASALPPSWAASWPAPDKIVPDPSPATAASASTPPAWLLPWRRVSPAPGWS